jgi:hypothetical protein
MTKVLMGAFVVGWVATLAAWLMVVVYTFKVIRSAQPGVSLWSERLAYNPANLVFHPELLTAEGLRSRQRLSRAAIVFGLLVVATLLLAAVTGALKT